VVEKRESGPFAVIVNGDNLAPAEFLSFILFHSFLFLYSFIPLFPFSFSLILAV